jgi:4-hydroxy-2-oxoheptanedioate aldolase
MKELIKQGHVAFGAWIDFSDPNLVEMIGYVGYDYVILEFEHSATGLDRLQELLRAADAVDMPALVRIPGVDEGLIAKILDAGAMGIIVAMVRTRADAITAVKAAKYPPQGHRGGYPTSRASQFAPFPAPLLWRRHVKKSNEETMVIPIIECTEGVENVEQIASVRGVDGILPGPFDLASELGIEDVFNDTDLNAMLNRVIEAAQTHGKWWMGWALDPIQAKQLAESGARAITFGHDAMVIRRLFEDALATMRKVAAQA